MSISNRNLPDNCFPVGRPGINTTKGKHVPNVTPKSDKFLYFTPELTKKYRYNGIHTPPQPTKSILVRLIRPHLAPFGFDTGYGYIGRFISNSTDLWPLFGFHPFPKSHKRPR